MCDYCEKGKTLELHRRDTDTNIQEIFLHTASDGVGLFIRQPKWHLENGSIKVRLSTNYAYVDIKYCPICGKELRYQEKQRNLDNMELPRFHI